MSEANTEAQAPAPVQGLALYLGRALVDDPSPVGVTHDGEGSDLTFRLRVGPDDLGKVIGKKGRTAKALRTLIAAAGAKQDMRLGLEIVEPDREERQAKRSSERADSKPADAKPATEAAPAEAAPAEAAPAEAAPAEAAAEDAPVADVDDDVGNA